MEINKNEIGDINNLKVGDINRLKILRKTDFGCFLEGKNEKYTNDILLHKNNTVTKKIEIGSYLNVFVYSDGKKLIATEKTPKAVVGEIAPLEVISETKIGYFVDLGIEKDVLLPFKEKKFTLFPGETYLFYLYIDKSGRLACTTDIDSYLDTDSPYDIGDVVSGYIYGFQTNKSAMVAVDNKYAAVILRNEYYNEIYAGEFIDGLKVKGIYEDGKLSLTPRAGRAEEMGEVARKIKSHLEGKDGKMKYNDKSDPEDIRKVFGTSKKNFKRALGVLMKEGIIDQDEHGTYLKESAN